MIGSITPPGVTRRLLGGKTTAAVPVGAKAIPLDLASDFNAQSGGVLRSEDAGDLVYTGHEDDVVSLAEPLAVELQADSPVDALDAEGNVQEEWTVAVDLGDGEDDPETCYIGTDLQGDFQEGEEQVDQSVEVVERDGRYWITARVDQQRNLDPSAILTPRIELMLPADVNIAHNTTTPLTTMVRGWSAGFWPPREDGFVRLDRTAIWNFECFADWAPQSDGHRLIYLEKLDLGGNISTLRLVRATPADNGYVTTHFSESILVSEGNWARMSVRQSSGATLAAKATTTTLRITMVAPL